MGKNKIVVLGISAVVLVALIAALAISFANIHHAKPAATPRPVSTSVRDIQEFCRPTDYKEICVSTLSSAAGGKTNPKDLVDLAFKITVDHIHATFGRFEVPSQVAKDLRTAEALHNCRELLDYAIDDPRASLDLIGAFSLAALDKLLDDLKVWLSAAVSYQETCLDGFEEASTAAAETMRKALNVPSKLTANILAIINSLDEVFASINGPLGRKLLGEEFPAWTPGGSWRLLQQHPTELKPDVTVANDGSGDVTTISEAVNRIPKHGNKTFIIYIEGVYEERIHVNMSFTNVMMVGDGPTKTKITGRLNYMGGTPTFRTATVAIVGDGFIGGDLWIENSAWPAKHQAVTLLVQSDKSVFYNCRFDGYQNTVYAHTKRQLYRECTISGTVDFMFGDAASIFQNCLILARKPLDNQKNIVTAQGRKERQEASAIVMHNCTIAADPTFRRIAAAIEKFSLSQIMRRACWKAQVTHEFECLLVITFYLSYKDYSHRKYDCLMKEKVIATHQYS